MVNARTTLRPRNRPPVSGRALSASLPDGIKNMLAAAETALAQPFTGVTTDGTPLPGLFPLQPTNAPTAPIRQAAEAFLNGLTQPQRSEAMFSLDSDVWRRWSNIHPFLMRHGVLLDALAPAQRDSALALMRETLSLAGFESARSVMKLNETIREITERDDEYGEWLYWLSILGSPSENEPWGWQLDGHHLIINCFILKDQMALTPMFMGSEPTVADSGQYAGTRVFEAEEQRGPWPWRRRSRRSSGSRPFYRLICQMKCSPPPFGTILSCVTRASATAISPAASKICSSVLSPPTLDACALAMRKSGWRRRSGICKRRILPGWAAWTRRARFTTACIAPSFSLSSITNAALRLITTSRRANTSILSCAPRMAMTTASIGCGSIVSRSTIRVCKRRLNPENE